MSRLQFSRRRFLSLSAVSASSLVLSGCDQFDFLGQRDNQVRDVLERANSLSYHAQRLLGGQGALAPEYAESEVRQTMRSNGTSDPQTADYLALKANNFADYRLRITGLVEKELAFSLDELRNMPARSQVTRHDCVEGWSSIAKWTGTPLGPVLDQAGVKPEARFAVYHCFDVMGNSLNGPVSYYETSDLIDAHHPQTILAYGVNNQTLPVQNGAPIRVRIERALGYKQPKFVHTIELVDSFAGIGDGQGGFWEDHGYDWYGGI